MKKVLAIILTALMLWQTIPVTAFAEEIVPEMEKDAEAVSVLENDFEANETLFAEQEVEQLDESRILIPMNTVASDSPAQEPDVETRDRA